MYKITLWDNNMPSCTSGVFSCFCEDIDEFEKEWTQLEVDEKTIERFKRSKAGEIVTDYYSDSPELNIVQHDPTCAVYVEENVALNDVKVDVLNGYRWKTEIYIERCEVGLKYVKFQSSFYMIAMYKVFGVCRDAPFSDKTYETIRCYGNPVIKMKTGENRYSDDRLEFSNDTVESFVYYPLATFETEEDMKHDHKKRKRRKNYFTKEELNWLLTDIPGEAG